MTTTVPQPTVVVGGPAPAPSPATPRVAWRPVLLVAGGLALVHGIASAWYGAFGDELYFLAAGHRAAYGYADQPPLVPWLAAALDHLAPGNLVVLRLPATAASAGHVVAAALLAAEMGGRRGAQLVAAVAITISPFFLATGHLLATSTIDPFLWAVLLWLVVRWLRTEQEGRGDDRLLLAAAPVLALTLFGKFLVPVLLAGLAVGVLVAGPRRLFGRPALWVALVLAATSTVPTLLWQAAHGWPQLRMGAVVAGEGDLTGNRWSFLPLAAWDVGLVPGLVLAGLGLWALLRADALRPWRAIGIGAVVTVAAMLAVGGRPYYVMGLAAVLVAAGAVALQQRRPARWWGWTVSVPAFVASGLVVAVLALPLGPAHGGSSGGTSSPRGRSAGRASPPTPPRPTGPCRPPSARTPPCSPSPTGTPRRSNATGPPGACRRSTAATAGSGTSARPRTRPPPRSWSARSTGRGNSAARSRRCPRTSIPRPTP